MRILILLHFLVINSLWVRSLLRGAGGGYLSFEKGNTASQVLAESRVEARLRCSCVDCTGHIAWECSPVFWQLADTCYSVEITLLLFACLQDLRHCDSSISRQ